MLNFSLIKNIYKIDASHYFYLLKLFLCLEFQLKGILFLFTVKETIKIFNFLLR